MTGRQPCDSAASPLDLLRDSPLNVEYEVTALVGQGSFGRVFRAKRRLDSEAVAIKVFTKNPSNPKSHHQEHYFRQECSLLRSFKHPHILKYLDFHENSSFIFLVVEFCAGGDLKQYLDRRPESPACEKEVAVICRAALKGLDYLHQKRSVIHRDIKLGTPESPGNILVRRELGPSDAIREADVCIADFGLSAAFASPLSGKARLACGTKAYHSPEQLGGSHYSFAVDSFALAVVANYLFFREHPFTTRDGKLDLEKMQRAEWSHLETAALSE